MPDTHLEHGAERKEPQLVSIPEMPDLLVAAGIKPVGLSRLRVLAKAPGFPSPVYVRGNVRLWDWSAVEAYFRGRVLRPGERTDLKRKQEGTTDESSGGGE